MMKWNKQELQISLQMVTDYAFETGDTSLYQSKAYHKAKADLVKLLEEEEGIEHRDGHSETAD